MTEKDALELGVKHLDLASRIVQFFIILIVAMWGWVITSGTLVAEGNWATRTIWTVLFALVCWVTRYAILEQARRINACLSLARSLADATLRERPEFVMLTGGIRPVVTKWGLTIAPIVFALVLLLWPWM